MALEERLTQQFNGLGWNNRATTAWRSGLV